MSELSVPRSSKSSRSGSSTVSSPRWLSDAHTPLQLLRLYPLPQVVRVAEETCTAGRVDLKVPLLLHKMYRSTKVRARSLKDRSKEVGPIVVIPDNYTGWFSLLTESGQTAPCYSTVEEVATARVPLFLVRNDVTGYIHVQNKDTGDKPVYYRTLIRSGHVLKLLGVFEDVSMKKGKVAKSASITDSRYIQCVNYKNEVLYLPFSAVGKFYSVATKGARKSPNHVYLMSHLLKYFKLPLRVCLVCGYLPKVPCNFTGLLKLETSHQEDVILACTLTTGVPTMMEIDIRSDFRLYRAAESPRLARWGPLRTALVACREEGEVWRRQMKVVQHVFPEEAQSGSVAIVFDDLTEEGSASRRKMEEEVAELELPPSRRRGGRRHPDSRQIRSSEPRTLILSKSTEDLPYCRVLDDVASSKGSPLQEEEEDNIYAEICESTPNLRRDPTRRGYYLKLPEFGGGLPGGSDGTFSSNTSSPEEDSTYDSFC